MNISIKVSGDTVILSFEKEHERYRHLIAGGADGLLVWIDEEGRIYIRQPEGPLPADRVREVVRQIIGGARTLGELAHDDAAAP